MFRRTFLRASAAALAAMAARPSFAQPYPSRPLTMWVPYAVGGNGDLTARLFADALGKALGQTVIVGNKPGAGGAIGAMHVIGSAPDGYTLLFSAPSVFSVTPHLVKVSYGTGSIQPVCLVSKTPLVLVVKKGSRFKSLADVVQAAKAQPGAISMGYSGLGTPNHLAMLDLEAVGQVRFNGIAYKGSSPMLQDMLAGQIEVAADQVSTSKPYIESGTLIPLAVFGPLQAALPGIPSVSSLGPEPFDVTTYLGVSGPDKMPGNVMQTLQQAASAAIENGRFVEGMKAMGSFVQWGASQDYARIMHKEDDFMRTMVAAGRIKAES
ncbi:tripartite tricarboxylate transporter substrate binding protein [Bordetella sp. BOR01]|uniref:tripartite tricarboxylate transporter substrate binding protein n=1 Tax=Bordetella sp. BOR01 TaxID=2854779 RepID=UPI001C45309A|nr:tripartite tricarboxylate transporter substrate binding protein [Bordetella sp. BOR01]MBV7486568.1 tripartite tricarboxylate transporter substrate binding protein [Bordetella sp. BOR01]